MNKYQEALDRVEITENVDVKKLGKEIVKIVRIGHKQDCKTLQDLIDKQSNHETELAKLNATIQNKNVVISILQKKLKKIPPIDFEEAMKFHRIELQENLGAIARLQEVCSEDEYGSKNYRLDIENVRDYLNDETQEAVNEVINNLYAYLDV